MSKVRIEPITDETVVQFASFLEAHMGHRRSAPQWEQALRTGWGDPRPDFGVVMRAPSGDVVGGIGALYATRMVDGQPEQFCNLTSWCVLDEYRKQSMRMAMVLMKDTSRHYTNFSPTEVVAGALKFLKFRALDVDQTVVLNVPSWSRSWRVLSRRADIESKLTGPALQAYLDHRRFPWLQHVLLGSGTTWCHVVYKRRRFKSLPSAHILHASDRAILGRGLPALGGYFLAHGMVSTHVETRLIGGPVRLSRIRTGFKPKLFLSATLDESRIDYLYSESVAIDL